MVNAAHGSAQEFVRLLKAPSDPPQPGGPLKVELAREAWTDTAFLLPNKDEVIAECLLTRLLKDKAKDAGVNPILDIRYWQLLSDVLSSYHEAHSKSTRMAHSIKHWLLPLLHRIPIVPIVLAFLSLSASVGSVDRSTLNPPFSLCFLRCWPLAASKLNLETLMDCFGALLDYLVHIDLDEVATISSSLGQTPSQIVSSYRSALANSANKKKVYPVFIQNYFSQWLKCIEMGSGEYDSVAFLFREIISAGVDTIFNPDVLRVVADSKYDSTLRDSLGQTLAVSPGIVLHGLPLLLESFSRTIKRYKNTLFSQGSSQAPGVIAGEVQTTGFAFFVMCDELLAFAGEHDSIRIWTTRIKLLNIIERESLYNAKNDEATLILRQNGALAVDVLNLARDNNRASEIDLALDILSTLTRIDFDLMSSALPTIWSSLLSISDRSSSVLPYFGLLLEYHSKARSVNVFLRQWIDAFSPRHIRTRHNDPRDAYRAVLSGASLCFSFADRLAKVVRGFLTPGQILDVVQMVSQRLIEAFKEFREHDKAIPADDGSGPRKRRKKDTLPTSTTDPLIDSEWAAITFALVSRPISLILVALPVHSVRDDVRQEITRTIQEIYSSVIPQVLKKTLKRVTKNDRRGTWAWQIIATASLRLCYSLSTAKHLQLQLQHDQDLFEKSLTTLGNDDILPEFGVEMVRALLINPDSDMLQSSTTTVDQVLSYVERHLRLKVAFWTGKSHHLAHPSEHQQGAVAMLHILLTRQLSLSDSGLSSRTLSRMADMILNALSARKRHMGSSVLDATDIAAATLCNGQFWEMHDLRDAFLARLVERTAWLDEWQAEPNTFKAEKQCDLSSISTTYELLLRTPEEYLSHGPRSMFIQRALLLDSLLHTWMGHSESTEPAVRTMCVTREFLRRSFALSGTVNSMNVDFFLHLMKPISTEVEERLLSRLSTVTLDLISALLSSFTRLAQKSDDAAAVRILETFLEYLGGPNMRQSRGDIFREACLLRFLDLLIEGHSSTQFNNRFLELIRQVQTCLIDVYSGQLRELVSKRGSLLPRGGSLRIWSRSLELSSWLQIENLDIPKFGDSLLSRLSTSPESELSVAIEIRSSVLDVILAESCLNMGNDWHPRLDLVVAACLVVCRIAGSSEFDRLHSQLAKRFRHLTAEDFSYILDFVYEALCSRDRLLTSDISCLIRLSNLLIHDAPEGTARFTQNHFTRCLNLFADEAWYLATSSARREILHFLNQQCNDRPATIRTADLPSLWSILGNVLSESGEHDDATDHTAFHDVVSIVSALLRLRRDLILNTLPHLGMILRQLIKSLKGLRPQLGAKQTKLVMNTLPRWINATGTLSSEEARALARLLTTLATKTIVRVHGQSVESQKAESLARPFSKHAAYVLTAYIETMNDPLCNVSHQIRRELQPGLFVLCDMLGEHNRDSMMMSTLDAGGKATMKALWKEYDKQRYIGKG